jgi:hypothetical protein
MNSFVKSLLNVIPRGSSTPSWLLNTISLNVPSGSIFIFFVNEGFLYFFVNEGFLYLVNEGFLYFL